MRKAPGSAFNRIASRTPARPAAPAPRSLFNRTAPSRPSASTAAPRTPAPRRHHQSSQPVARTSGKPDGSAIAAWHGPRLAQAATLGGLSKLLKGDLEHAVYTATHPVEHAAGHLKAAKEALKDGRPVDAAALATGNAAIHGKKF